MTEWWRWVVVAGVLAGWFAGVWALDRWLKRMEARSRVRAAWEAEQRELRWERRHTS